MTARQMHDSILARTRKLRLKYVVELNRGSPWISVHERGLGRDKGNAFFAKGPDAARLIDEVDKMSEKFDVSISAAFLFLLDSSGMAYTTRPNPIGPIS